MKTTARLERGSVVRVGDVVIRVIAAPIIRQGAGRPSGAVEVEIETPDPTPLHAAERQEQP